MHLHGYNFAVLGVGYATINRTTGHWTNPNADVVCESEHCVTPKWNQSHQRPTLNLKTPPVKDTVVVPARGYVVLQFKANNPGVWLFHCHQELHRTEGMVMAFAVGGPSSYPTVPHNFPTCFPYPNGDEAGPGVWRPTTMPFPGMISMKLYQLPESIFDDIQNITFFAEDDAMVHLTFGTAIGVLVIVLSLSAIVIW